MVTGPSERRSRFPEGVVLGSSVAPGVWKVKATALAAVGVLGGGAEGVWYPAGSGRVGGAGDHDGEGDLRFTPKASYIPAFFGGSSLLSSLSWGRGALGFLGGAGLGAGLTGAAAAGVAAGAGAGVALSRV